MPAMFEVDQVGKKESLADLIANVEAAATPFSSMLPKRAKPIQVEHSWQVKSYRQTGHKGVVDGKDATNFTSQNRVRLRAVTQKSWELPAVSDFAGEATIAGAPGGEMKHQIADALVVVKRIIEKRCLSNEDQKLDDGVNQGNETRGIFQWVNNSAQTLYPVDADFRTPAAAIYTGALDEFSEAELKAMARANYKERHGTSKLDGFVGIDLKAQITDFASYSDDVTSKTNTRTFTQRADSKMIMRVIDRLNLDTGQIDLHPISFGWTDVATGADSAYTHRSGVFVDLNMVGLMFTRMPSVKMLPNLGGGEKAIVDVMFMLMCDNPLGHMAVKSNSAS
ncbi:DUF5309 domain-containing protein [bacterium]|nr:DUF5309 domain-containing protein [bacterium]